MARNSGTDDLEPPREWVEQFLVNKAAVREVMDEVQRKQLLGEYETARERLRSFAKAQSGIFRTVSLVTLDVEQFYEDLRSQYGGEETAPIEELEEFGSQYEPLRSELEVTLFEVLHGYHNPKPSVARQFRYSKSTNMPRLEFDIYSGNVDLCTFEHPPSQALTLAGLIVDGVGNLLEHAESNDDEVAVGEIERAASVCQQLESDIEQVRDCLESVEDIAENDDRSISSDTDDDRYQDWGVY